MVCVFFREMAYTKCGICNAALHNNPSSGKCKGRMCFLDYHSDVCLSSASVPEEIPNLQDWSDSSDEDAEVVAVGV